MAFPKVLVFVRHEESIGNPLSPDDRARLNVPNHEFPLTPTGRARCPIGRKYLRKVYGTFDVVFASYLTRAIETATAYAPKQRIVIDSRLAEGQRGIWHDMTNEAASAAFPSEAARKGREGLYHYRPFGGQNWPDMEMQCWSFLDRIRYGFGGKKVLVVSHQHRILMFQHVIEGHTVEHTLQRTQDNPIGNGSVLEYRGHGKRRLKFESHVVPWKLAISP